MSRFISLFAAGSIVGFVLVLRGAWGALLVALGVAFACALVWAIARAFMEKDGQ